MKIIFGECLALGEEAFFAESRVTRLSVKVSFFFKKNLVAAGAAAGPPQFFAESRATWLSAKASVFFIFVRGAVGGPASILR
jgi:hypothetical protein